MRPRASASQRKSAVGNPGPTSLFPAIGHPGVPGILGLASILFLAACGGGGGPEGLTLPVLTISPQPASVPVNGTVVFTENPAESSAVIWTMLCGGGGSLSSNTGTMVTYTAPATPPIYIPPCNGIPGGGDGQVVLQATTGGIFPSNGSVSFTITAPTISVGILPMTATVALSGTEQFVGFAVGNVNNGLTWQVNGVTGGSAATGTITNTVTASYQGGLYTAPSVMPMAGSTVTITVISQADPTKTQTAVVTLH